MYNLKYNEESYKIQDGLRFSKRAYTNTLVEMFLMSECEFFVGTQTSNMDRVIYELMQTRYPDASWRQRSLDSKYQFVNLYKVIVEHVPEQDDEIELRLNDVVLEFSEDIRKNETNTLTGYSQGENQRTNKTGFYPSYKTRQIISTYDPKNPLKKLFNRLSWV